jgi:predicted phage terminase large subunit-like protein
VRDRLKARAERKAAARRPKTEDVARLPLLDFVPRVTPRWQRPEHLARVAELFERARRGERVRALVSAPPRHGKTELILHAIPWYVAGRRSATVAYVAYGAQFAHGKSRLARGYAREAGFDFSPDFDTIAEWRNRSGGGCIATGIDGPLTGKGCDLLIVDDPHKDRVEAESPHARDLVEDWFRGTGLTRLEPGGSAIVFQQRWVADDLIGRLDAAGEGWEYVNLPALLDPETGEQDDERGVPLWPGRWSREALQALKLEVGEYNWASQYGGNPRPRGGRVYQRDPVRYVEPRLDDALLVLSVDGAGTEDTRADFTAAVAQAIRGHGHTQTSDILEVWQEQLTPEHSAPKLLEFQRRRGGGSLHIEATRDGKAIAKALQAIEPDLDIRLVPVVGDKFLRAQSSAAAWNQGRVRVPAHAPWLGDFLAQVSRFTGVGSVKDDMVDGFTLGWNLVAEGPPVQEVSPPDEHEIETPWVEPHGF